MEKFRIWYLTYQSEITWWVIGWLTFAGIDSLARGNYISFVFDAALAYFNYYMWKQNVR